MLTRLLRTRGGRALLACLGLGAYLLMAGAPLVHAAAHGGQDTHDHAGSREERIARSPAEIHHPSLHDVSLKPVRGIAKVALSEPLVRIEIVPSVADRPTVTRLVRSMASRGPPPGDPARAPPHA
jgi:hypothetical protein